MLKKATHVDINAALAGFASSKARVSQAIIKRFSKTKTVAFARNPSLTHGRRDRSRSETCGSPVLLNTHRMERFGGSLRGEAELVEPIVSTRDELQNLRLTEAIARAAKTGGIVEMV